MQHSILLLSLLALGSGSTFLSSIAGYISDTTHTLIGNGQQASDASSTLAKSVVFRDVAAVDYAAQALELLFQRKVVDFDDELARQQFTRSRRDQLLPENFWRSVPITITCLPNQSHGVIRSGYIECSARLQEKGRKPVVAHFASYYMISQDPVSKEYSEKKEATFNGFVEELVKTSNKLAGINELQALKALMESTSAERKKFSPFHPEDSVFDMHLRVPLKLGSISAGGDGEEEVELMSRLVLLSDASGGCNFPLFAINYPLVMYRMLYDPQSALPFGAPIVVDPPVSLNTGDHVKGHAANVKEFLGELAGRIVNPKWAVIKKAGLTGGKGLASKTVQSVLELVDGIIRDDTSVQSVDLTHPLAYRTGSLLAPPTTSVFDLDLFNRVFVGRVPGLWLIIRSQNRGEAFYSSYVNAPFQLQTTHEFDQWAPAKNDPLMWVKYQINNGSKGLFFIILWDDDLDKYAGWYEQVDLKAAQSVVQAPVQPISLNGSGRVGVQPVPKRHSHSASPSRASSGEYKVPTSEAPKKPGIYPNIDPPQPINNEDLEKEAARKFYSHGLPRRSRRPIIEDDGPSLEDQVLQLSQKIDQSSPIPTATTSPSRIVVMHDDYVSCLTEESPETSPTQAKQSDNSPGRADIKEDCARLLNSDDEEFEKF